MTSVIALPTSTMTTIIKARRVLLGSTGTISAYAAYKAKYDPPHLVWDLDHTLLCSVTPLPKTDEYPHYDSFTQIDDDFPYRGTRPNTRTYWRPGARGALQLFRYFAVQHVYTAAQETYTENILDQMDRTLFTTVLHRDCCKQPNGKDLQDIIDRNPNISLSRCILFDDRTRNFQPQDGENGVHVKLFEVQDSQPWKEYVEVARWTGIVFLALLVPDVRTILPFFQSADHKKRFGKKELQEDKAEDKAES